jgi:hypothetical protein
MKLSLLSAMMVLGTAASALAQAPSYAPVGPAQEPVYLSPAGPACPPPACCVPVHVHTAYRPLVPLAPMPAQFEIGRGILGQPKLYVPGQPIRNFFRYLSP